MTGDEIERELTRPWRHGEHADLRGVEIAGGLDLSGRTLRGFDLSGARIGGDLDLSDATLGGLAWLNGARIGGTLRLDRARTRLDLRARGLDAGGLSAEGAQIAGIFDLDGAHVSGRVRLAGAVLLANLSLEGARLEGGLDLEGTEVMGGWWSSDPDVGREAAANAAAVHGRHGVRR